MERRAPGRPHLLDGLDVRRHAHDGDFHAKRRGRHARHLQPASDGQAARDVPVHRPPGRVPADAVARHQLAAGDRRRHRRRLLLVQLPDHPGGPQHEDAGDRLLPVGAGRARLYLPEHREQEPLARESAPGRRPVQPGAEPADQGEPPADHLLPRDPGAALRPGGVHRHPRQAERPHRPVLHRIGPAAGRGRRRYRHEREQAASACEIHPEHHARGLRPHAGQGGQGRRPGLGLCHGVVLRLGGTAQPDDPELQRRLVGAGRRSGEVRDDQAAQARRPDEHARDREGAAPVLGAAAFHGRAHVYGRDHRVPVRPGPVPVQGEGEMVAHRGHGHRRPDGGGQPFHGLYEALFQCPAAVQQVPDGVHGARRPAGDAARAGLPHAGPHRQGRL